MTATEFLQRVREFSARECLLTSDNRLLIGVSGGADSVALLMAAVMQGRDVVAVHFNHHLRGDEADRDEAFVTALCERLGCPLRVVHLDVRAHATRHGISDEMAGRELRYARLEELRVELGCDVIAVAHHRDDQVETVMLNALRGSGVRGLAGMRPRHGNVVRPLLCVSRADIEEFLVNIGQQYITDSTNAENTYKRNRVRNVIMPVIEQQFAGAGERLATTIATTARGVALYDELVGNALNECVGEARVGTISARRLDYAKLRRYTNRETLLFEWLHPHGFSATQVSDIATAIAEGKAGLEFSSFTLTLLLDRHSADLVENSALEALARDEEISLEVVLDVAVGGVPFEPAMVNGRDRVALPLALARDGRLRLRHRRDGDRMTPYGMRGAKAVSDIFTDLKLTTLERRAAWLLTRGDEVLWIVGHRAGKQCHVEPGSTDYALLSITEGYRFLVTEDY